MYNYCLIKRIVISSHANQFCTACRPQTDGWLSSRSAAVYEFSTETLFFGRQDSMQRTCLLPIADYMAAKVGNIVILAEKHGQLQLAAEGQRRIALEDCT